ncbi:hypothetical protein BDV96DRAFT_642125 [Lophiotrema nucula]|uniref:Uncharacterized protein n=1 Tax=Lophiotrema nucula TaxID=690887 RepID=A0A6A5ZM85_9PLEO|nr:hypothetical protein BDV96DRAFT_642125 [Lophiotrema nucula]
MDPHSYTNPHPPSRPRKLGLYHDILGEYEDHDTVYTLLVRYAQKPPHLNRLFALPGSPMSQERSATLYDIPAMKVKKMKFKAYQFPYELRCKHVQDDEKECKSGICYVLDYGTGMACRAKECEGHGYAGLVKRSEEGVECFGKKGERIVCIESSP